MQKATTNMIELIVGAILMSLGLIYLTYQSTTMEKLVDIIFDNLIEDKDMHQQYSDLNLFDTTEVELYTAIMGYRMYPILIDGKLIPIDQNDYELYVSYIHEGTYEKQYVYDSDRNIVRIMYSYKGKS